MDYFKNSEIPHEEEQHVFLQTIYHDKRGGNGIRVLIYEKENRITREKQKVITTYASQDIDKLIWHGKKENAYIALSSHVGKRRVQSQLYNRSVIYIDLDNHCEDDISRQKAKDNTKRRLNKAFNDERLPIPTMITDTGRGYGLFYVLDKSIAYTENTERLMRLFNYIYKGLMDNIQLISKESEITDGLQVDNVVTDSSRVVRMPGTINQNVQKECRLIGYTGHYFSIEELRPFAASLEKTHHFMQDFHTLTYHVTENPIREETLLACRIEKFIELQKRLRGNMTGVREYCCFQVYNAALQFMQPEEAIFTLEKYNDGFSEKLSDAEIHGVIQAVNKKIYHYTDFSIMDDLSNDTIGITTALLQSCGFGKSYRRVIEQKALVEANKKARKNKWDERKAYILAHPELTYEQLGVYFSCNPEYLQRKMREMGVYRNQVNKKQEEIIFEDNNGFVDLDTTTEINPFTVQDFLKAQKPTFFDRVFYNVPIDEIAFSRFDNVRFPLLLKKEPYRNMIAILLMMDNTYRCGCMDLYHTINKKGLDKDKVFTEKIASITNVDPDNIEGMQQICKQLNDINNELLQNKKRPAKRDIRLSLQDRIRQRASEKYIEYQELFDNAYENLVLGYGQGYFKAFCGVREYFFIIKRDSMRRYGYQTKYGYIDAASFRRLLSSITEEQIIFATLLAHNAQKIYHEYSFYLNIFYNVLTLDIDNMDEV